MAASDSQDGDSVVFIYDRRNSAAPEVKLSTTAIDCFAKFKDAVKQLLGVEDGEDFVIATTNRDEIKDDKTWDYVENGETLYILKDVKQELCAPAQERVDYLPHYDTIVKGGMYEYYASEGQNPLPYAFAELIDNSLAATALNDGSRQIELRLFLDDIAVSKNCIVVIDNGKGMTPRQLNNWAIYRLSKFTRRDKRSRGQDLEPSGANDSINLASTWAPRFMNSDISYFGVGGKQAVFFIGNATRMISKPRGSKDVHELSISKDEFERREKSNQSIYTGYIRNRQPGDSSHLSGEDELLAKLISEEPNRESFTAVVIQGISPQHVSYLKHNFNMWTRQLAHIYHFYLHGPEGHELKEEGEQKVESNPFNNINIQVTMQLRGNPNPKSIDLRKIEDDIETQYVRTAASRFEFKAYVDGSTAVEGIVRYHPFRYDKETYPVDAYAPRLDPVPEDDHGYAINDRPARGRRPIFEAFWNGRLIPYTLIEEFDWCSLPKKQKNIPAECYNRISGVLWTNDSFQVSTNKLTFLDLEMKLRDKGTNFVRMLNGHERRTQIEREFQSWLKECNEEHDKQILFSGNSGLRPRLDLPKQKQTPWTRFDRVEWDARTYEKGQMVRVLRTTPPLHGTIEAFYLSGEHQGDVFAMGGDIEILQEPQSLYTERKFVALNRLDRGASVAQIKKYIEEEETKLPDHLVVSWPNGMPVIPNEKRTAGKTIGDLRVEICNKRGETISKIPHSIANSKKLLVELTLIWHSPHGDERLVSLLSQHGKSWPYWFRKMDSAKNLGNYTLLLQTVLNESGNNMFAGRELPSAKIKFSVNEADPEHFTVGLLDGPFKVGVPFQIPLEFQDRYNNSTRPPQKLKPILDADGLELSYENTQVKGNNCYIKGVVAKGTVNTAAGKSFNLTVSVPGLEQSQSLKIRLLPGPPARLMVKPDAEVTLENGSSPSFFVEVHDPAGNVTCGAAKMNVFCKFAGGGGLPNYSCDCSASGSATLTGPPLIVKKMAGELQLTARIEIVGMKTVKPVERVVWLKPSGRVSQLQLFCSLNGKETEIKSGQALEMEAGSVLENIRFEICNEAGEALAVDDKLAQKIKVNWAPKVPKDQALKKCLPSLKAPTLVTEHKYCQATVMEGDGVELQFSVMAQVGEPSQMKAELTGENSCLLGEPLAGMLNLTLMDGFGNQVPMTAAMCKEVTCQAPSLFSDIVKVMATSHNQALVRNLVFTQMGSKEVELGWRGLTASVKCEVLAGPPAQIQVLDWSQDQVVSAYSDRPLPCPLKVQLLDAEGNLAKTKDVKVHIVKDAKVKMSTSGFVKTDKDGVADFGTLTLTADRGRYELQPKATVGRSVVNGPKLVVEIMADPNKPVKMDVVYNEKTSVIAGHTLADFSVTMISEEGSPLTTGSVDYMSLRLWRKELGTNQGTPPNKALSIAPEVPTRSQQATYQFRKCPAPTTAADYNLMFLYCDGSYQIQSRLISLTVQPGSPSALVVLDRLTTATVSNTRSVASRTLLKSLKLELQDEFGNSLGEGYNGQVKVEICAPNGHDDLPTFVSGVTNTQFPLTRGQCTLQSLVLQESSPGKDGFEYHLACTVTCAAIAKNRPLPPLHIPFLFYNDARKQQQMASLSKERDKLQGTIQAYRDMFDTQQLLVQELRASVHEAQKTEQTLRSELRKQNIPSNQLQSVDTVEKLIAVRTRDRDQLLKSPRRSCGLTPADPDPDILGKIAHLALVHQDDIARVLSWHMLADMDCVVTLSTSKAKELYHRTQGKQQVLPLDSIYRKNLPDWDKPLPHRRFLPNYKPLGNPVYARNLLEFTKDEESCKVVYGMLLGDTLILDTLDQANLYRQEIIKYTHCPTILTRSGDRIRSNGKFGGAMNKAPPVDKMKGCVFGQPLPLAYHAVCTQIESLEKYKTALVSHISAQDELQEQVQQQKLPEAMEKYHECKEAENRLKEVEARLGVGTPVRATKQGNRSATTNSDPEPALKKPKLEPGSAPSSSASPAPSSSSAVSPATVGRARPAPVQDPSFTPSRTSLRIASMTTVVSDDGRKRLKKSST